MNSLINIIVNTDTRILCYVLFDKEQNNVHIVINAEDTGVICITIQFSQSSLGGLYLYIRGQYQCPTLLYHYMLLLDVSVVVAFFGQSKKCICDKLSGSFGCITIIKSHQILLYPMVGNLSQILNGLCCLLIIYYLLFQKRIVNIQ